MRSIITFLTSNPKTSLVGSITFVSLICMLSAMLFKIIDFNQFSAAVASLGAISSVFNSIFSQDAKDKP